MIAVIISPLGQLRLNSVLLEIRLCERRGPGTGGIGCCVGGTSWRELILPGCQCQVNTGPSGETIPYFVATMGTVCRYRCPKTAGLVQGDGNRISSKNRQPPYPRAYPNFDRNPFVVYERNPFVVYERNPFVVSLSNHERGTSLAVLGESQHENQSLAWCHSIGHRP